MLRIIVFHSRVYLTLLLAKSIWFQKLTIVSCPCVRNYRVSGWCVSKIRNVYLTTDLKQLPMHTASVRNNALHDLTLNRMNIPPEHSMFHICALRTIYIAVVYQHKHSIKYAYRKIIFDYIFRSLLLPSSGFLCKNVGKTNKLLELHNTAISQYPNPFLSTAYIHRNIK
jgi:hypothetical protein